MFCFEPGLLRGRHSSPSRNAYLLAALRELDAALQRLGGRLLYRDGLPEREIPRLATELAAGAAYVNVDHTPHAQRRDRRVAEGLAKRGIELVGHDGITCADVGGIETRAGAPYRLFTPFSRAWLEAPRRALEPRPRRVPVPSRPRKGSLPAARALGVDAGGKRRCEAFRPGERGARRAMAGYLQRVRDYARLRDVPAADATSRLSAALHFGCVSPLELEARLREHRGDGAAALRRQLAWRDFHLHLLRHDPGSARRGFRPEFRRMRWRSDRRELDAWKAGETGYPLVDAAMRQLLAEGWMHNRARLAVASFLTKDLLIDWREGESHFMRHLVDGDEASNNGNWQWSASAGADPQPWFRIFNPVRQQRRFDPEGAYVRRYVPELRRMPDRWLATPWEAPADAQHQAGCVIGRDYPGPIVDHGRARDEALERFSRAASRGA